MYCWAKNTYYAPLEGDLPDVAHRDRTMVASLPKIATAIAYLIPF